VASLGHAEVRGPIRRILGSRGSRPPSLPASPLPMAAGKQSSPFASFALERAWPKYYWAVQDDKKYTEGYVEEARWGHHKGEKSMP